MTAKVPTAQDLLRRAGAATGVSRRRDYSATTKQALVEVARDRFAREGYAATSLDEIVAGAEVTKGALYHHFRGKQELFEAVFALVEEEATTRIRAAVKAADDPWAKALNGLREFLAVTRTADFRRVVIQDGPAVLGYERFREQESRTTYGLVHEIVSSLLEPFALPERTVQAFTQLFFGAMSATGSAVSLAEDPQQASDDAEGAIVLVLAGIRSLVLAGDGHLPTAAELVPDLVEGEAGRPPSH